MNSANLSIRKCNTISPYVAILSICIFSTISNAEHISDDRPSRMAIIQSFSVKPDVDFLAWSNDDSKIVTSGKLDLVLTVWEWRNARKISEIEKKSHGGGSVILLNEKVVTTSFFPNDGIAFTLWDYLSNISEDVQFPPPLVRTSLQTFSVDLAGDRIALLRRDRIVVFDTNNWSVIGDLKERPEPRVITSWIDPHEYIYDNHLAAMDIAISPDGNEIATADIEGSISIYNIKTGIRRLRTQIWRGTAIYGLCWSPDGKAIAFSQNWQEKIDKPRVGKIDPVDTHAEINIISPSDGSLILKYTLGIGDHSVKSVSFSADSMYLAVADFDGGKLDIFDIVRREMRSVIANACKTPDFVLFSHHGRFLAVSCGGRVVVMEIDK